LAVVTRKRIAYAVVGLVLVLGILSFVLPYAGGGHGITKIP